MKHTFVQMFKTCSFGVHFDKLWLQMCFDYVVVGKGVLRLCKKSQEHCLKLYQELAFVQISWKDFVDYVWPVVLDMYIIC